MKSVRTRAFKRRFKRLPQDARELARQRFRDFLRNPKHPAFRIKRIRSRAHSQRPLWEFSLDRSYRAACYIDGDTYVWTFIGDHSEFDQTF